MKLENLNITMTERVTCNAREHKSPTMMSINGRMRETDIVFDHNMYTDCGVLDAWWE